MNFQTLYTKEISNGGISNTSNFSGCIYTVGQVIVTRFGQKVEITKITVEDEKFFLYDAGGKMAQFDKKVIISGDLK